MPAHAGRATLPSGRAGASLRCDQSSRAPPRPATPARCETIAGRRSTGPPSPTRRSPPRDRPATHCLDTPTTSGRDCASPRCAHRSPPQSPAGSPDDQRQGSGTHPMPLAGEGGRLVASRLPVGERSTPDYRWALAPTGSQRHPPQGAPSVMHPRVWWTHHEHSPPTVLTMACASPPATGALAGRRLYRSTTPPRSPPDLWRQPLPSCPRPVAREVASHSAQGHARPRCGQGRQTPTSRLAMHGGGPQRRRSTGRAPAQGRRRSARRRSRHRRWRTPMPAATVGRPPISAPWPSATQGRMGRGPATSGAGERHPRRSPSARRTAPSSPRQASGR